MTSALPFSSMTELHAARQVPLNAKMTVEEQSWPKDSGATGWFSARGEEKRPSIFSEAEAP